MESYEISEFVDSMKNIESFLSEFAARERELRYAGIGSSRLWESYKDARSSFEGFERKLYCLIRISKFVDRELYEQIKELSSSNKIAEGLARVAVTIRIAELRRSRSVAMKKAANNLLDAIYFIINTVSIGNINIKEKVLFDEFDIPLSKLLVGINRLIPLTEEVETRYYSKRLGDEENFHPANINVESINLYIEQTLNIISSSGDLGPETKKKIVEYLEDVQTELASKTPRWKNIVGALVIISAILGGLAVAPQAFENVQKAITEILGTSIEKSYPRHPPENDDLPKLIMT